MSMTDLRDEYEEREQDIGEMLYLARTLYKKNEELDKTTEQEIYQRTIQQINIIKSSLHMIMYNQVENTARGCIESIYDHLKDANVSYASLKEKIQVKILHRIISDNDTGVSLHKKIGCDISSKIIVASLNIRKEFNGNVSKDILSKITKAYGINLVNSPECHNGVDLDLLKDIRNELAHGSTSFSKKGQLISLEEVEKRAQRIDIYLKLLISSTEDYIATSSYLAEQHAF